MLLQASPSIHSGYDRAVRDALAELPGDRKHADCRPGSERRVRPGDRRSNQIAPAAAKRALRRAEHLRGESRRADFRPGTPDSPQHLRHHAADYAYESTVCDIGVMNVILGGRPRARFGNRDSCGLGVAFALRYRLGFPAVVPIWSISAGAGGSVVICLLAGESLPEATLISILSRLCGEIDPVANSVATTHNSKSNPTHWFSLDAMNDS